MYLANEIKPAVGMHNSDVLSLYRSLVILHFLFPTDRKLQAQQEGLHVGTCTLLPSAFTLRTSCFETADKKLKVKKKKREDLVAPEFQTNCVCRLTRKIEG